MTRGILEVVFNVLLDGASALTFLHMSNHLSVYDV